RGCTPVKRAGHPRSALTALLHRKTTSPVENSLQKWPVVCGSGWETTVSEAEDLIERAESAGRLLSVFHNRRWDADFLTVQRLLTSGELGRLTSVESRFNRFRPEARVRWRESGAPGSGLLYDLGAHLVDQALCLFGMPETIPLDLARQRDGALAAGSDRQRRRRNENVRSNRRHTRLCS
ncbi:Gfo/Idh/MocA family protein, partial [Thiocapsa sp.]|uniref:Gfo/Idh/MocA family protein n=1 Tax=Thiocapsa sp. TaxID=2024551 RepID=UPI002C98BD57